MILITIKCHFSVSLIGWSLSLYGVSTKPPHHPSRQQSMLRERQVHPLASMLEDHDRGIAPPPPSPLPLPLPSPPNVNPKPSASFSPESYAIELGGKPPPPPPFPLSFGSDFLDIWDDHVVSGGEERPIGRHQSNGKWYDNLQSVYQAPTSSGNNLGSYHIAYPGGYGLERLNSPRKSNVGGGWQRIELTRQSAAKSVKSSSEWWLREEGNASSPMLPSLLAIFYTCLFLFVWDDWRPFPLPQLYCYDY